MISYLGDELIGITRSTTFNHISVHPEFANVNSDIHLYFVTRSPTVACKNGRTIAVTVRCDPSLKDDEEGAATPKACPDGTCDGKC